MLCMFSTRPFLQALVLLAFLFMIFGRLLQGDPLSGTLFVVAMAAFNLVIDFDIIEQSADEGAPKYMEYFGSMALTITLVWLYIEILRLLMKLNSRR